MKSLKLSIIALAAIVLGGCAFEGAIDEPVTAPAAPAPPISAPAAATSVNPAPFASTTVATAAAPLATPAPAKPSDTVQAYGPHIDASAFLNALVESGCQIDKAEYKEVKRGGAIKVVCSRTVDPLNVDLDDL